MLAGLLPGSLIAGYRVESRIGAGGMAMVFRARDEALGRTVALKVLAPALAGDREFRERFIRESRAAAAVDHPHIIPVYAAGDAGGVLYIAMRFVAGGDLRALVQREGPLSADRTAFLLSPLASALDAGHAAGLVHRDVKPANALIDISPGRPDHPYLSDFGLAKGTASTGLTGTGQFLGTLEYSAPEQISGKGARPQTDQYALACVAYTMFTGTAPFPHDEPTAILWAHMSEPPPAVTARRPDLPPGLDEVVARAMAKNPDERYPTCTDFADALRAVLAIGTYSTPSHAYSGSSGTALPSAQEGGGEESTHTLTRMPVPVPPSPLSTPPATVPARPSPATPTHAGTANSAVRTTARRPGRRIGIAAAAVVVVAGGATAAALLSTSTQQGNSTQQGSPTQRGNSTEPIATLTDPSGGGPTTVAFKSDSDVIAIDSLDDAYEWNIAVSDPAPAAVDVNTASDLTAKSSAISPDGTLQATGGSQASGVQIRNVATGKVVLTLTSPQGGTASAFAFSPDGTELAAAYANGSVYVWKIPR